MNDCIWFWVYVCDTNECRDCKQYISVNCELGKQMREAYWRDIDKALEPVRKEWARKKGGANAD